MKNDPKWRANAPLSTSSKRAKNNESGAYTSSSNAETNDDEVRPIGQKATNAQLKRKGKAKETAKKGTEDWHGMWNDFLETQKEKIAAAQKLSDATEKKTDYEIFTRDTSSMTVEQLEQHRRFCDAIKAKWGVK